MEKSDCKPELGNRSTQPFGRFKAVAGFWDAQRLNVPSVPEDTNPKLATGKHQYIVIERYTSIFNKTCPTQGRGADCLFLFRVTRER